VHEASRALTRTANATLTQFHMHPWAAIDPSMGMKNARDLLRNLAIFSFMAAGFTPSPIIVAADADTEHSTHPADRILLRILGNKRITKLWVREKMASASDRISPNLLIFHKNTCTIIDGEARLSRSRLEKIPQNPAIALELDS